jgi:hypothetical protein
MHFQVLKLRLRCLALAGLLSACAGPEPLAERRFEVVGGTETGEAQASVLFVAAEVRTIGGVPLAKLGSGTLVAPNLVATALHVVSVNPSNVPFTCDATGNEVSGSKGSLLGATVAPEKVAVYGGPTVYGGPASAEPLAYGRQIVSTGSSTICENDLAFVILDRELSLPVVPVRRGEPIQPGEVLTAVGFGSGEPSASPTRTQRDVNVTAAGQWIRTFTVSEGPCEGDSGGPALSAEGAIVGVFSTVGVECTGPNAAAKYTDLSFFSKLVERAFEAGGDGSPWATVNGEGGASGASAQGDAGQASQAGATGEDPKARAAGGCSFGPRPVTDPCLVLALWLAAFNVGVRRVRAGRRAPHADEYTPLV